MTQRIGNPFPYFGDRRGRPLTGGKVYLGEQGADPQTSPVSAFYDSDLSQAAAQPINVIGGLLVNESGNPTQVYVDEDEYSIRVRDADGAEVSYLASATFETDQFQPLDSDLTAIAALATTTYGRALLALADAAALRTYAGIVAPLPLAGGSVTGEIKRSGAGAYPYMADAGYTVARIFVTANGAADPRTQVGDIWFEEET